MTVKSIKVLCSLNQCIHGNLKRKSDYSKYLRRKSKLFINRDYFLNQNAPKYCMSCSNLMKSDHRSVPDFLLSVHENLKKPPLEVISWWTIFFKNIHNFKNTIPCNETNNLIGQNRAHQEKTSSGVFKEPRLATIQK